MSMYDHYFSNFGSSPVPEDICKDSAIRHARFWRRRFLKVFPIQMHRGGGECGGYPMTAVNSDPPTFIKQQKATVKIRSSNMATKTLL